MKRTLIALLILIVATTAFAEPRRPAGQEGPQEMRGPGLLPPGALAEFLDLSEAQIAQADALRETQRQQIKAAHDAFKASFEAMLTADQKAKFALYQELVERRPRQ